MYNLTRIFIEPPNTVSNAAPLERTHITSTLVPSYQSTSTVFLTWIKFVGWQSNPVAVPCGRCTNTRKRSHGGIYGGCLTSCQNPLASSLFCPLYHLTHSTTLWYPFVFSHCRKCLPKNRLFFINVIGYWLESWSRWVSSHLVELVALSTKPCTTAGNRPLYEL
jgi:hypothetical protein